MKERIKDNSCHIVRGIVSDYAERSIAREQGIWVMPVLEIWHRPCVDDDRGEEAVGRVKADFARSLSTLSAAA